MIKKPEEYALEYAGFWHRAGASFLDFIFLSAILFGFRQIFYKLFHVTTDSTMSLFIMILILWLITIAYILGFWVWRGQTPGKMLAGIKIIRTDSSPLDWPHAILRYLGYLVSTVTLLIGFIWIAFDHKKQGLHDKIADTYVVKLPVRQVVLSHDYARGRIG